MDTGMTRLTATAFLMLMLGIGAALAMAADQAADTAKKATPTYVGSKACKVCHMGEKKGKMWEIWSASKHASSLAALDSAKGERSDPKCLKCHTTGYGVGGYGAEGKAEMTAPDVLGSVGCEDCHGPGSEYKNMKVMKDRQASIEAGLIIPDENTCKKCHNEESPTFKGFKFDEYWAKIAHKLPPPAEAEPAPQGGK